MEKTFFVIIAVMMVLLLLVGCGKSNDRIAKTVKTSLQRNLSEDPQYSNLNLMVTDVTVNKQNRQNYTGIAKIKYADEDHEVPLKITVEGTNITWDFEPGALSFIEGRY